MMSILLVAERTDSIHQGVNRALMLARYLHARLDIVLADPGRALSDSIRATTEARAYLDALRQSVTATDVEIATDSALSGPLHEHVASKVRKEGSHFIVKSIDSQHRSDDSALTWRLVHSCPAPLLLTQGRPWHPQARFAVAVGACTRSNQIMAALQLACSADLNPNCIDLENTPVPDDYDVVAVPTSSEQVLRQWIRSARCDFLVCNPLGQTKTLTQPPVSH
jgi:hypothetical protein